MLHFSIQLPNTHKHAHTHRAIAICDQVSNLKTFWMEFRAIFSKIASISISFFSIWVFFYEHSQFTGQQGKREGIYLTPLYHFHPLHGHLDISRAIAAESSPLRIAGSRTRTGNLWFPNASR